MDPHTNRPACAYTRKAERYARYRWQYARQAIRTLFEISGLGSTSVVADLGTGTGILAHEFGGRVAQVYAIEPDPQMRRLAEANLAGLEGVQVREGSAESSGLPDQSVDLAAAGQAVHWFDPQPARTEIGRILRPGGWLAALRNYGSHQALGKALEAILIPENGVDFQRAAYPAGHQPAEFYFGSGQFERLIFPFSFQQDWEAFFGAVTTASYAPDEDDPLFARLEQAARQVFERFQSAGTLQSEAMTELVIGRPAL